MNLCVVAWFVAMFLGHNCDDVCDVSLLTVYSNRSYHHIILWPVMFGWPCENKETYSLQIDINLPVGLLIRSGS